MNQVEIKVYKKRWFVLALLTCLMAQMIFIYLNFGFLNNILVLYFTTSYATIDWLYLGWNIGTTAVALLTSWLAAKEILTCRRSMIVASILQAINSCFVIIAFLRAELLFLLIIGQTIGGISLAVLWPALASLAQLWFPEFQIGLATGISMLGSSSGAIAGYLLPAHILKYPLTNKTSVGSNFTSLSWKEFDKNAYQHLYSALLAVSLAVLTLLLTVVPEQPEKPPSLAQHQKRVDERKKIVTFRIYVSKIKKLVYDSTFWACAFSTCLLYYFLVIYDLTMEQVIARMPLQDFYLSPENISAYVLALNTFGSWLGNIPGGVILDKYKNYRLQSSVGAAVACLFALLILLSVYIENLILLFFSYFFQGLFSRIAYLSVLDSLMQHTYPIDPIFVMGILVFLQNVMAVLVIEICRQVTYHGGMFGGLGFVSAMLFSVAVICLIFKMNTRRLLAETSNEYDKLDAGTPLLSKKEDEK